MSIKTIRPGIAVSPMKQQYLDYVAQQYDMFVEYAEKEPDALVFGFCDDEGNTGTHWLMPNEPEGSNKCAMYLSNITLEMLRSALK